MNERERRVKMHVAYTYLLFQCLKFDERTGLYRCPSKVWKLIVMHEMEKVFDFDLWGVPGFFYDVYRTEEGGGWMVNLPEWSEAGYVKAVNDDRGRITSLHILKSARDARPRVLTSKGLPLGS